jgi:predicted nucleic acid-binding Zn ribbon protein
MNGRPTVKGEYITPMPISHVADDEEDDDDPEDPDESDMDSDDDDDLETQTEPCPHCGADVYVHAQQCPVCGEYISTGRPRKTNQPRWIIITVLLILLPLIYVMIVVWRGS